VLAVLCVLTALVTSTGLAVLGRSAAVTAFAAFGRLDALASLGVLAAFDVLVRFGSPISFTVPAGLASVIVVGAAVASFGGGVAAAAGADTAESRPGRASRGAESGGGLSGPLLDGGEPSCSAPRRTSAATSGDAVVPSVTSAGPGRGSRASTEASTAGSARRVWNAWGGVLVELSEGIALLVGAAGAVLDWGSRDEP
jgi:hypothetical protein